MAAVDRYEVDHPVLDDPGLVTWNQYAVRAWPTLAVVDPEGYVVAQMSGEGHGHGLAALLDELIAEHTAKGTLRRGASLFVPPAEPVTGLRFPAKVALLPSGELLVGDARNHSLAVVSADRPRRALAHRQRGSRPYRRVVRGGVLCRAAGRSGPAG